jgi:argininosuccinate lyase
MQEDKEALFDAVDTVRGVLCVFPDMLRTMRIRRENMRAAAGAGFINATDCADYLVYKGLPFRDAYKATGQLVALCIDKELTLETLPIEEYKNVCDLFEEDVYEAIDLDVCVKKRTVKGGPSPECVLREIEALEEKLG